MTLGDINTRPRSGSREHDILKALRSGGYAIRYNEDDGVHRIMAPGPHGTTAVGLLVIRNGRIAYAEFLRRVYPWWGRPADTDLYDEALTNLEADVDDGKRK